MTEEQILARLLARDEGILAHVEAEWGPLATALAQRILQSPQDAEECLQDGLMALWDTVPPQRPASLRAYFLSLVRNRALDVYRAEHREKRGGGVVPLALEELGDCAGPDSVEDRVGAKLLGEAVNRFLGSLPERDRDLFLHRYYFLEELPEIADFYRMTRHQVSVRLHRTRKKLKDYLKKEELL